MDFKPKTDLTFIAPNENFNSFSQKFSKHLDQKTSDGQKSESENVVKSLDSSVAPEQKPKSCSSAKINDKFVDFIVKQYKSDGFICTLDENERQIYYCYYCHQYISDFDLIQTHIDSSKHLNSCLNGISFDRGLDKEFVIESISEKRPKNIQKLIYKELSRIPLHFKHYYYRNGIRLMDVMPPNAYFCTLCKESIPNFKSIETHLITEKHISSQQKPTLMQLIDKTDDPVLKIGLQFITEEKIADSSLMVYECELCNCFDCNTDKMFAHIKSCEHRTNLLKRYDYETKDLTDEELEHLIEKLHEKHGSGLMKISQSNNKIVKTQITIATPECVSPNAQRLSPEHTSDKNLTPDSQKSTEKPKINYFLCEDKFLKDFESHKIIETLESDGREMYFCCYCDEYYNSVSTLKRHVEEKTHQNFLVTDKSGSRGLNNKLSMKKVIDSSDQESIANCLENIPILVKHFYFKRGIKYLSDGLFYCRFCQLRIETIDGIEDHFKSETHISIEENPTKFNDLLFQTNQPIIGLNFIKELIDNNSKQIVYECTLCDYTKEFCQMFMHLNCFTHQYRVLRKLSPNNSVLKSVKEKEVSLKSSELLKNEICKIEMDIGCGFVTKSIGSPKVEQIFVQKPELKPQSSQECDNKTPICEQNADKDISLSPIIKSVSDSECLSHQLLEESKPNTPMTVEMLLSSLPTVFAVKLNSEDEASELVSIVESLKDSLIKYYNVIPVVPKHLMDAIRPKTTSNTESTDDYYICKMEEC